MSGAGAARFVMAILTATLGVAEAGQVPLPVASPLPAPAVSSAAPVVPAALPSGGASDALSGKGRNSESQQGSRALNRFEADPVIHSIYQMDGNPLEVDPD